MGGSLFGGTSGDEIVVALHSDEDEVDLDIWTRIHTLKNSGRQRYYTPLRHYLKSSKIRPNHTSSAASSEYSPPSSSSASPQPGSQSQLRS